MNKQFLDRCWQIRCIETRYPWIKFPMAGWSTIGKPDGALNDFLWTRHILINPDLFPAMLKQLSFATNEFGTLLPKTSVSISVEPRINFVLPHFHITSMLLIGGENGRSRFTYPNKVLEFCIVQFALNSIVLSIFCKRTCLLCMAVFYPEEAGHHHHHNVITMCMCVIVTRNSSPLHAKKPSRQCFTSNRPRAKRSKAEHTKSQEKRRGKQSKAKQNKK